MTSLPLPSDASSTDGDYLTISIDDDLFALKVDLVHEVLDPPPVTLVPNAPAFAPGLVNVRGNILPLVDMRRRLGLEPKADTEHSRVIVSKAGSGQDDFLVGIKADAVHEVLAIASSEIEALPENSTRWPAGLLSGVVRHNGRFVILLELERILRTDDPAPLH
ncbi:chemotaxis protein CheW [Aureimonas psammosilenae]|uniref:chemotaxis protein CheW n=1 Tax=Aureimonas psammosilenae TaxID=2495496 RepID=UPI00126076A5|nr:chemotaxis protein CheW [Aureimonas psammosilenae]